MWLIVCRVDTGKAVWVTHVPRLGNSARVLLQILIALEEKDRESSVVDRAWRRVWTELGVPQPPSLTDACQELADAELVRAPGFQLAPAAVQVRPDRTVHLSVWADQATHWQEVLRQACDRPSPQTPQLLRRAVLTAMPYLLRLGAWRVAAWMAGELMARDESQETAADLLPWLQKAAEGAEGTADDLEVQCTLAMAEEQLVAELGVRRLRDVVRQADARGDREVATSARSRLALYLQNFGDLAEARNVIEHALRDAQSSENPLVSLHLHGRQLQIMHRMGQHVAVIAHAQRLLPQLSGLEDEDGWWDAYEMIVSIASSSAAASSHWTLALHFNGLEVAAKEQRHAPSVALAQARFNAYGPLLHLERLDEVDALLHECHSVFSADGDAAMLGRILAAQAQVAFKRDDAERAADLTRQALSHAYMAQNPFDAVLNHVNQMLYLRRLGMRDEAVGHGLAAAMLAEQTGREFYRDTAILCLAEDPVTVQALARRGQLLSATVAGLVQTSEWIRFVELVERFPIPPGGLDNRLAELCRIALASG
ncbi:hypothetical protein Rhe02_08440 [Rhizocola hellebori]|uniref:Uncharacterized protein n=1 Tax=Rhizocola hellebori TaxID=1392758 RepID=A0A8J3Q3F9_9ACTN|nr:hypothetical protein [Rhizocola hellebori]GIH02777.1 hypothetical protein Rhe02_08440 [Rhizocola hellebori]